MKLDDYELELLQDIEKTDNFEKIEHYEEALMEAGMAAKNYLTKTKNINIHIPAVRYAYAKAQKCRNQYTLSNDFIIADSSICYTKGFVDLRKLKV